MPNLISFPKIYTRNGARTKLAEFVAALRRLPEIGRGAYCLQTNGLNQVAVVHNGHVLGVWRVTNGCYRYTPMSHRLPTFECVELGVAIRQAQEFMRPCERVSQRERRRHRRWPVHWPAMLQTAAGREAIVVENVSTGGLGIKVKDGLAASTPLVIELQRVRLIGHTAWIQGTRCGVVRRKF